MQTNEPLISSNPAGEFETPRRCPSGTWPLDTPGGRFYDAEHHREAIRSRPMLMAGVGRQTQSGGRRTVRVSLVHDKGDCIARAVTQISNELHQIVSITEKWTIEQRWTLLLTRLLRRWLGGKWLNVLPEGAEILLSG